MLQIYNSIDKDKQPFEPLEAGKVGLYVCGVTVYDYCHIGHARTYVVFDTVYRYLQSIGYDVTYVRNITDVDDKIIARAAEAGVEPLVLTENFTQAMHEDYAALNLLPPDIEPKATETIEPIIALIQRLIASGHAYQGDSGDVYFETSKYDSYGALAHQDLDALQAGARIDVATDKKQPLDFVLWKMAKPGEISWPSPWGEGRPGWHIECSAMSMKYLGETFDIHGGGNDLKFPHHENERAQSEACCGKTFVRNWMHVGFLQINDEKMSKSLKNFFTIREVLAEHHPEAVRYFLISSHYRSPINFNADSLQQAHACLATFYTALRGLDISDVAFAEDDAAVASFRAAMNDDFNTPLALSVLFELAHAINTNKKKQPEQALKQAKILATLAGDIGLLQNDANAFLQSGLSDEEKQQIEDLIQQRQEARQNKQWDVADKLRDELQQRGIELEDGAEGTLWRRV